MMVMMMTVLNARHHMQSTQMSPRHPGEATHSNTKSSMPSTDCQEPCREQIKWGPLPLALYLLIDPPHTIDLCRLARGDQIIAFIPEISTPKPRNPYNIIQTCPQRRRGRASGTHGCRAPRRLPPGSVTVPIRRGGKWSVESRYKNFLVVVPFSEMPAMSCSLPGETTKSSTSRWIYKAGASIRQRRTPIR